MQQGGQRSNRQAEVEMLIEELLEPLARARRLAILDGT
jgi:hypothetical protein